VACATLFFMGIRELQKRKEQMDFCVDGFDFCVGGFSKTPTQNLICRQGFVKSRQEKSNSPTRLEFVKIPVILSPITKEIPIFPLDRIFGFLRIYY
jgi:hypothetical protein